MVKIGWNCPECGHLMRHGDEDFYVETKKAGYVTVNYTFCSNCGAEYITVWRNEYIGLVKLPALKRGIGEEEEST